MGSGSGYGYSVVTDQGFISYGSEMEEPASPWGAVVTKKFEGSKAAPLTEATVLVAIKLRIKGALAGLLSALAAPGIAARDKEWDSAQRRLASLIAHREESDDAAEVEAAGRLREKLLRGPTGTGQTSLDYAGEVDFGRVQVQLTAHGQPLHTDVKKLGLEKEMAAIEKTTEALAASMGRKTGEKRRAPSTQVREAEIACVAAFNAAHEQIEWLAENTSDPVAREPLTVLLRSLEDLLARHTSSAVKPAAPPVADAVTPAGEGEKKPVG